MRAEMTRKMFGSFLAGLVVLAFAPQVKAQQGFFTSDDVIKYTPDWHGEDFPTGGLRCPMTFSTA